MATLLYRLGRASYRRPFLVIGVWLALLVGVLGGGIALGGQTQESFAIPGTESQDALDRLEAVFPQVAGANAQAVLVAPDGSSITDERYRDPIDELTGEIGRIDGIDSALGPFDEFADGAVSDDEQLARIQVQFEGQSSDVTESTLAELTDTAAIAEDAGLRIEYGGQVFQDNTFGITVSEVFGVAFAGVVLIITFGSLAAAGMPLLSALIGVGIVIGGITGLSAFTTVSSTAPLLALMIGLAVGIDYSLFILSRHRNQLARGEDPEESTAIAVGTAGSAVVFAGVTVIIALLGLLVVGIPFLSVMGVGAAFAVLIAIAVATTLLPGILGVAKGRLAPKPGSRAARRALAHDEAALGAAHAVGHGDGRTKGSRTRTRPPMGLRWVRLVMRAPILVTLAVVAVLGTLAIPSLSLDLNLPDGGSEPEGSTQREAYDLTTEAFGPGFNGPLVVAVDITQTVDIVEDLESIGDEIRALDDVSDVSQGIPDPSLDTAIIQVTPESAPDSAETKALVQEIRDLAPEIEETYGTPVSVTGATAVGIDISNRLTSALVPFGLIVVGLSVVLLMMVFRSVLVPIKAALGFLLSVVASFGVVVAVFQWGWLSELLGVENPGPILSFMPILLMAVLFGLAMDYEVFLVSGMREEFVRTGDARRAVERGFADGARVVTAAALIMFFVFFAFVPEGSGTIKPIALGLAVGIAFDAFLVRMTLVPAVMTLLGRRAWWLPAGLARFLPDVDVEGERLREHREAVEWVATQNAVISAEGLVVGAGDIRLAPLDAAVPRGALAVLSGSPRARRLALGTLAGRLVPLSGYAQVVGHALPSEMAGASRTVAVADAGGTDDAGSSVEVGGLIRERVRLSGRRRRAEVQRWTQHWLTRLSQELAAAGREPVDDVAETSTLAPLDRAVVLAVAALAESTPVVMVDGGPLSPDDELTFARIVDRLADPGTTVVVAASVASTVASTRPVVHLALGSSVPADLNVLEPAEGGTR